MISASCSSPSSASCGSRSSISAPRADPCRTVERGEQRLEVVGVVVAHPVDEEGGRPVHAAADAAQEILVDPVRVNVLRELLLEEVEIEVERTSVGTKVVDLQMLLVLVEVIVHLPEPVLGGRGLSRLRRLLRMRMCGTDREVPEHEPELLSHPFLDLLDDRVGLPTVGALIVAVLHEAHRCIRRPLDVVPLLRHRQDQTGLPSRGSHRATPFAARSSSAIKMPSAPGFTSVGET